MRCKKDLKSWQIVNEYIEKKVNSYEPGRRFKDGMYYIHLFSLAIRKQTNVIIESIAVFTNRSCHSSVVTSFKTAENILFTEPFYRKIYDNITEIVAQNKSVFELENNELRALYQHYEKVKFLKAVKDGKYVIPDKENND